MQFYNTNYVTSIRLYYENENWIKLMRWKELLTLFQVGQKIAEFLKVIVTEMSRNR